MDKKKIEHISELLEFSQSDFSEVHDIDEQYQNLLIAGRLRLISLYGIKNPGHKSAPTSYPEWEDLLSRCTQVKDIANLLYNGCQYNGILTFPRTISINCRSDTSSVFKQRVMKSSNEEYQIIPFFPPGTCEKEESPYPPWYKLVFDSDLDFIFDLVEGLPFERLKKCPECGNIFIQKTAREKIYCSNNCKVKQHLKNK